MTDLSLRRRIYLLIEDSDHQSKTARFIELALITLIAINVFAVTIETIEPIYKQYQPWFDGLDTISVIIFSFEYAARLWVCVEREDYQDVSWPRLRYALTPMALIDLLVILPFYLQILFSVDLRFMRALRLLRVFKLTRYSAAMTMLIDVIVEESNSFMAVFSILFILLVMAASGAYLAEHEAQPDAFGSVPQAMWWAVVTLTTVGYGDVTPVTGLGKFFGSVVAIIGIGIAAMPAGILASGIGEHLNRQRDALRARFRHALEDGVIDPEEEDQLEELRRKLGIRRDVAMEIRNQIQGATRRTETCTCPHCGTQFTTAKESDRA